MSRTVKTRKFKLLYFRNETCFGAGNLYKDLFSIYLQPGVNKNRTLQYDDVIVKIINTAANIAGSTSVKMADRMSRIRVEKNEAKTRGNDVLKT